MKAIFFIHLYQLMASHVIIELNTRSFREVILKTTCPSYGHYGAPTWPRVPFCTAGHGKGERKRSQSRERREGRQQQSMGV